MSKIFHTAMAMTVALVVGGNFAAPSPASAATVFEDSTPTQVPVMWVAHYWTAGSTVTVSVANASWWSDPVLSIIRAPSAPNTTWSFVAGDDDSGGWLDPSATFVVQTTGTYYSLVHGKTTSQWGVGDLFVNGTKVLNQVPFGGNVTNQAWSAGETFRATGYRRGFSNDFMMFLKSNITTIRAIDDDSGPKNYPLLIAPTSVTAPNNPQVVWGLYPGATGAAYLTKNDGSPDSDNDGLCASLEALLGTADNKVDSDSDGIPDILEAFGNDGWSFSEIQEAHTGSGFQFNPVRRNVYVEYDYMTGPNPGENKQPYGNLPSHVAEVFRQDGSARAEVVVDNSMTWREFVALSGGCGSLGNTACRTFNSLKDTHFAPGDALKQAYFHYAIGANRATKDGQPACIGGQAEVFGNDLLVTHGAIGCGSNGLISDNTHHATLVHELGHNLRLRHQGNDHYSGQWSEVHNSVMNYRYAYGIPGRSGHMANTYSFGDRGCTSCSTSPKLRCGIYRNSPPHYCNDVFAPTCDCDYNEWGQLIDYKMTASEGYEDGRGVSQFANEDPAAASRKSASGKDLVLSADSRRVPRTSASAKAVRALEVLEELRTNGLVEGKDYTMSDDGLHVYME